MLENNINTNSAVMQSKVNRIVWFDFAKLVAIYLVLFGHSLQYLQPNIDPHNNYMWMFIYSFHMPLFMLISGYFSYNILQVDFHVLFKKKAIQLIVPCVIWGAIWYLLKIFLTYNGVECIQDNLLQDIKWLTFDVLWFLKSLFLCVLLCFVFRQSIWLLVLSVILAQVMPFKMPSMYPCFLIGLLCHHIRFFDKIDLKYMMLLIVLFAVLYYFFKPRHMQTSLRSTANGILSGDFMPFLLELWRRLYCLLTGIMGSLAVISLCKMSAQFLNNSSIWRIISEYGSQTQAVYILHGPIMVYGIAYFVSLDSLDINLFNIIVCPMIAIVLLLFCLFLINQFSPKLRKILFGSSN